MNRTYRSIRAASTGSWQAVSELARAGMAGSGWATRGVRMPVCTVLPVGVTAAIEVMVRFAAKASGFTETGNGALDRLTLDCRATIARGAV